MVRIAITSENIHPLESAFVRMILDRRWDFVHLRHPNATLSEMKRLLDSIPQNLHSKLRIHGHFELLSSYNLGGLHLNRRCPKAPATYSGCLSQSCHSFEEISDIADPRTDYVTISPVFDSISKKDYRSQFGLEELSSQNKKIRSSVNMKIIGLGGITPGNAHEIVNAGLDGIAVLGYLMSSQDLETLSARLDEFDQI